MRKGGFKVLPVMLISALVAAIALTVAVAKPKMFDKSEDAGKVDEPTKWLPDYDKLQEGGDTDWVYFPAGSLKAYKSVTVKAFTTNAVEDHEDEAETAAKNGKKYLEQWLKKGGFNVVDEGAELTFEGNVFDAWEPSGAGRYWGGWMANPGCGLELMAKDTSGKIVAEIRHKARGSTVKDAVENGLETIVKDLGKVK
jgi:hypothetical protein